ncbi:MAG: hypothetical protein QXS02_04835 [Candidatus Thermoplasmatota archaeon]
MSRFIKRLEKNIKQIEKNIEKEENQLLHCKERCEQGKITKADYTIKKNTVEERIRAFKARIRTLQGLIAKEKRRLEEKELEKQKKQEEKEKR